MEKVLKVFASEVCGISPCEMPTRIKKIAKRALEDKEFAEALKKLAEKLGVELNLKNELTAYITISKLAEKVCFSLM